MAAAAPVAPDDAKRPDGDEWCDSGLGSLGDGPPGPPMPAGPGLRSPDPLGDPGVESLEPLADPAAWLRHVLSFVTEDGDTALHLAVIHEHEEFLDSILRHTERSPYLDLQNDLGQTALHIAVVLGLAGAVQRLRAAGAGATVRERGGHTPLHLACREGRAACAQALLGGPPDPRDPPRDPHRDPRKEEEESRAQLESVNYDGAQLRPQPPALGRGGPEPRGGRVPPAGGGAAGPPHLLGVHPPIQRPAPPRPPPVPPPAPLRGPRPPRRRLQRQRRQ